MFRTQRVRDPVHGLIVFRGDSKLDQLAWSLLDAPEFQRLRRIRQLGVSEFVFPTATHTRFAHSIGVFHTARCLVDIIRREVGTDFDQARADVAVAAALLHDLGHGPFSHTFEGVQKSRGVDKRHERWTAEIIRAREGRIRPLLDAYREGTSFCDDVAALVEADDPADIYHAVVSSSFDADRLDYLRRDRLMTGTGAGAIDFDWLMEHVRVRPVAIDPPEVDDDPALVPTFCLDAKALPAAEQFLLSRYTLHEQVYFHKTTRCAEAMIGKLLRKVAELASSARYSKTTGLDRDHPLIAFLGTAEPSLSHYLALDDIAVLGSLERMAKASDPILKDVASRLRERRLYKTLDIGSFGHEAGRQQMASRRIDRDFASDIAAGRVIKDDRAAISAYTRIGGDVERAHKRLHIVDAAAGAVEITSVSNLVDDGKLRKQFTRYFFEDASQRDAARPRRKETP